MHPTSPLTVEHSLGAFPTCHVDPLLGGDLHEYCGAVWSNVLTVPNCTVRICLKSNENGLATLQRPLLMLLLAGVSGAVRAISSVRISLSSSMTCSLEDAGKLASDLVEGHGHAIAIAPPPILAYGDTLSSVGLSAGFSTLLLSIFFDVRCLQLSVATKDPQKLCLQCQSCSLPVVGHGSRRLHGRMARSACSSCPEKQAWPLR